jgi:hypothetical protein
LPLKSFESSENAKTARPCGSSAIWKKSPRLRFAVPPKPPREMLEAWMTWSLAMPS